MARVIQLRSSIVERLHTTKEWAAKIVGGEGILDACKRKSVGCALLRVDYFPYYAMAQTHNGPSRYPHVCTNEVGNCGCSHAEPRAVMSALRTIGKYNYVGVKLLCLCQYSPCTTCANILIDSGLICGCVYETLTKHDRRGAQFLSEVMPVLSLKELTSGGAKTLDALEQWGSISSER